MSTDGKTIDRHLGPLWRDSVAENDYRVVGHDRDANGRFLTPLARTAWEVVRNDRSVAFIDRVITYANYHGPFATALHFAGEGVTVADVLRWIQQAGQSR